MDTRWSLSLFLLQVVFSQMTFSDGWNKRAVLPLTTKKPRLDACNIGYSQGIIELHQQMMELYNKFAECQKKDGYGKPATAPPAPVFF